MSLFNRITTWAAGQILKSADLNGEFNNLVNGLNNLDAASTSWTNVKTGTLNVTGAFTLDGTLATNAAGYLIGSLVQKVSTTSASSQSIVSTSFANATNWNTSITPKASTHIIRVTWTGCVDTSNSAQQYFITLQRGATNLGGASGLSTVSTTSGSGAGLAFPLTMVVYDSPATTSSIAYGIYAKSSAGTLVISDAGNAVNSTMILEEIAQ